VAQVCPQGHSLLPVNDAWGLSVDGYVLVELWLCDACRLVLGSYRGGPLKHVHEIRKNVVLTRAPYLVSVPGGA
jgi:hypothetical protein